MPAANTPAAFFVARQPIVDAQRELVAYELLFRAAPHADAADIRDGAVATARVLEGVLINGLDSLTDGVTAFVNFPSEILTTDLPAILQPPAAFVIEVLEDVPATENVLAHCTALRAAGYRIALDDVCAADRVEAFRDCADLIKVDWLRAQGPAREQIASAARAIGAELLAEKVETEAEFTAAVALGVQYFQGFLLGRPVTLKGKALPGINVREQRLVDLVCRTEIEFDELETIVASDPSLTYKMLRYANSAAAAQRREITSLRDCLVLLGQDEIRRIATLVMFTGVAQRAPVHAIIESVVRARLCEAAAAAAGVPEGRGAAFLAGLLSRLDAILGTPMADVLETLPVTDAIRSALLSGAGPIGAVLRLAAHYEAGDWGAALALARHLGIAEASLPQHYAAAIQDCRRLLPKAA